MRHFISMGAACFLALVLALAVSAEGEKAADMHKAAAEGNLDKIEELLKADPALLEAGNAMGNTPIFAAARNNQAEAVKLLAEKGADPNAKNKNGTTALMWATQFGKLEGCKALIESGADLSLAGENGIRPIHLAAYSGDKELVEYFIEKGADLNAKNGNGATSLTSSYAFCYPEIVKLLIDNGADVKVAYIEGEASPLNCAVIKNDKELIGLLFEKGADVNWKGMEDATALHIAMEYGDLDLVKMLVSKGADVNAVMEGGLTPIVITRDKETIEYLKANGAKDDPEKRRLLMGKVMHDATDSSLDEIAKLQKDYFGEHNKYAATFKDLGYEQMKKSPYTLYLADDVLAPATGEKSDLPEGMKAAAGDKGYTVIAVGNIDDDETLDVWTMDESGKPVNKVNDIEK